jgi:cytochrome c oxidase cbb3-type subunit III
MRAELKYRIATAAGIFFTTALLAETAPAEPEQTVLSNGVFLMMLTMIVFLLLIILAMAEVVKASAALQRKKIREEKAKKENGSKILTTLLFLVIGSYAFAQGDKAAAATVAEEPFTYWRMGAGTFYLMLIIIVFELIAVLALFRSGMKLLDREESRAAARRAKALLRQPSLMEKLNKSVAIEEEEAIMTGHDYDGIRELDNDLPPWWKYGFYVSIVFAIIYLFHFHVLSTGKSSQEEYAQEMQEGEMQVAAFKKTAANLVDETTVTLQTDEAAISAGRSIFSQNCAACHGPQGGGIIGPNLTDDYWLHGGSVQDVFKSIKYGWTDKGMKSWQQDLKAIEIQQVTSFIKSLRGTKPENPKAQEGELYSEGGGKSSADSAAKADTLKAATVKK